MDVAYTLFSNHLCGAHTKDPTNKPWSKAGVIEVKPLIHEAKQFVLYLMRFLSHGCCFGVICSDLNLLYIGAVEI